MKPVRRNPSFVLTFPGTSWKVETVLPAATPFSERLRDGRYYIQWLDRKADKAVGISVESTGSGHFNVWAGSPSTWIVEKDRQFPVTEEGFTAAIRYAESHMYDPLERLARLAKPNPMHEVEGTGPCLGWIAKTVLPIRDRGQDRTMGNSWFTFAGRHRVSLHFRKSKDGYRLAVDLLQYTVPDMQTAFDYSEQGFQEAFEWAEDQLLDPLEILALRTSKPNPVKRRAVKRNPMSTITLPETDWTIETELPSPVNTYDQAVLWRDKDRDRSVLVQRLEKYAVVRVFAGTYMRWKAANGRTFDNSKVGFEKAIRYAEDYYLDPLERLAALSKRNPTQRNPKVLVHPPHGLPVEWAVQTVLPAPQRGIHKDLVAAVIREGLNPDILMWKPDGPRWAQIRVRNNELILMRGNVGLKSGLNPVYVKPSAEKFAEFIGLAEQWLLDPLEYIALKAQSNPRVEPKAARVKFEVPDMKTKRNPLMTVTFPFEKWKAKTLLDLRADAEGQVRLPINVGANVWDYTTNRETLPWYAIRFHTGTSKWRVQICESSNPYRAAQVIPGDKYVRAFDRTEEGFQDVFHWAESLILDPLEALAKSRDNPEWKKQKGGLHLLETRPAERGEDLGPWKEEAVRHIRPDLLPPSRAKPPKPRTEKKEKGFRQKQAGPHAAEVFSVLRWAARREAETVFGKSWSQADQDTAVAEMAASWVSRNESTFSHVSFIGVEEGLGVKRVYDPRRKGYSYEGKNIANLKLAMHDSALAARRHQRKDIEREYLPSIIDPEGETRPGLEGYGSKDIRGGTPFFEGEFYQEKEIAGPSGAREKLSKNEFFVKLEEFDPCEPPQSCKGLLAKIMRMHLGEIPLPDGKWLPGAAIHLARFHGLERTEEASECPTCRRIAKHYGWSQPVAASLIEQALYKLYEELE